MATIEQIMRIRPQEQKIAEVNRLVGLAQKGVVSRIELIKKSGLSEREVDYYLKHHQILPYDEDVIEFAIEKLEKEVSKFHGRREKEEIIKKVEKANAKFPELIVPPFNPRIKVELERKYEPNIVWWPDIERTTRPIYVEDFLVPLYSIEGKPMDCTSIEFFYRKNTKEHDSAMLILWYQLLDSKKGMGLGNKLFDLTGEIAKELQTTNVFGSSVTNESFWEYKGCVPFKEHKGKKYWKKL